MHGEDTGGIFTEQTAVSILKTRYDYLVHAIHGLSNKCLMIAQCRERDIPTITSGAAGSRRDGTAVRVADLNRAKYDKLLFKVRKQLRQKHGFPRCKKNSVWPACIRLRR